MLATAAIKKTTELSSDIVEKLEVDFLICVQDNYDKYVKSKKY